MKEIKDLPNIQKINVSSEVVETNIIATTFDISITQTQPQKITDSIQELNSNNQGGKDE